MAKDVNKRNSIRSAKLFTEIVISAVILSLGAYGIKTVLDRINPVGSSPFVESSQITDETLEPVTEPVDPDKIIFESASIPTKQKFDGDLILVNHDHKYFSGNENLVVVNEMLDKDGRTSYVGNDYEMKIIDVMYEPLSRMMDDFNAATGYDDIVIIGGFRTTERQQELYDEDLENTGLEVSDRVALPGHSEHESGYAVDFTTSTTWDYDGTGEYDWINKNCWKYGFILRYNENKTDITQIKYEPWHYRYVGIPHAYYIYTNDICLEEYIDLLKNYTYESEHLCFTDENGEEYEIYYVPSDDGSENTIVPIPTSVKYEISGNNIDGFIVTVYPNQEPTADNSAEGTTEEATEAPDEEATEAPTEEPDDDDESSSNEEATEEESSADDESAEE